MASVSSSRHLKCTHRCDIAPFAPAGRATIHLTACAHSVHGWKHAVRSPASCPPTPSTCPAPKLPPAAGAHAPSGWASPATPSPRAAGLAGGSTAAALGRPDVSAGAAILRRAAAAAGATHACAPAAARRAAVHGNGWQRRGCAT